MGNVERGELVVLEGECLCPTLPLKPFFFDERIPLHPSAMASEGEEAMDERMEISLSSQPGFYHHKVPIY